MSEDLEALACQPFLVVLLPVAVLLRLVLIVLATRK